MGMGMGMGKGMSTEASAGAGIDAGTSGIMAMGMEMNVSKNSGKSNSGMNNVRIVAPPTIAPAMSAPALPPNRAWSSLLDRLFGPRITDSTPPLPSPVGKRVSSPTLSPVANLGTNQTSTTWIRYQERLKNRNNTTNHERKE